MIVGREKSEEEEPSGACKEKKNLDLGKSERLELSPAALGKRRRDSGMGACRSGWVHVVIYPVRKFMQNGKENLKT